MASPRVGNCHLATDRLLRDWLTPKMEHSGLSQANLARELGSAPPQVSAWLDGKEKLPQEHIFPIAQLLSLSDAEVLDLHHIVDSVSRLIDLGRLFIVQLRRGKKTKSEDLQAYFDYPARILERLISYVAENAGKDININNKNEPFRSAQLHLSAALKSSADINQYMISGDNSELGLFNHKNINYHLRYPHHYYVAFYLDKITPSDGSNVIILKDYIFSALEACVDFIKSDNSTDQRIAQHALHLLARYRGHSIKEFIKMDNQETKRMALFGEVYRMYDEGDFESLASRIVRSSEFGSVTLAFDGLHYGDYANFLDVRNETIIPVNAMVRQIVGLRDSKASIRRLSAARLHNILNIHEKRLGEEYTVLDHIRRLKDIVDVFVPDGPLETSVRERLRKLMERDNA